MNSLPTHVLELLELAGPDCEAAFAAEMDKLASRLTQVRKAKDILVDQGQKAVRRGAPKGSGKVTVVGMTPTRRFLGGGQANLLPGPQQRRALLGPSPLTTAAMAAPTPVPRPPAAAPVVPKAAPAPKAKTVEEVQGAAALPAAAVGQRPPRGVRRKVDRTQALDYYAPAPKPGSIEARLQAELAEASAKAPTTPVAILGDSPANRARRSADPVAVPGDSPANRARRSAEPVARPGRRPAEPDAARRVDASDLSDSDLSAITDRVTRGTASRDDLLAYTANVDRAEALAGTTARRAQASREAVRGTPSAARARQAPEAPTLSFTPETPTPTTAADEAASAGARPVSETIRQTAQNVGDAVSEAATRAGAAVRGAAEGAAQAGGAVAGAAGSAADAVLGGVAAGGTAAVKNLSELVEAARRGVPEAVDQISSLATRLGQNPTQVIKEFGIPTLQALESGSKAIARTADELTALGSGVTGGMLRSVQKTRQHIDSIASIDNQLVELRKVERLSNEGRLPGFGYNKDFLKKNNKAYEEAQESIAALTEQRGRMLKDLDDQVKTMPASEQKLFEGVRMQLDAPVTPEFVARVKGDDIFRDVGAIQVAPETKKFISDILGVVAPPPGASSAADEAATGLAEALGKEIDPSYLAAAAGVGLAGGLLLGGD